MQPIRMAPSEFFCFIPPSAVADAPKDPEFFPCDDAHPARYPRQIGWVLGAAVIVSDHVEITLPTERDQALNSAEHVESTRPSSRKG